jgi:hypothetical protein
MDKLNAAIEALDLDSIENMKPKLTLDSTTLSACLHALSRRILLDFAEQAVAHGRADAEGSLDTFVEHYSSFYSAVKGVAANIGKLDASLDLSPWHVFGAREEVRRVMGKRFPYSFRETMLTLSGLSFGVRVVLLALPLHRSRAQRDNAFMTENSAGETPMMHLLRNYYPPANVHALCLRGGGFSTREWQSGAVLDLLTHHGNIETLVDAMLHFFRSDFLYQVHVHRVQRGEGLLQTYCHSFENAGSVFSDVRLFVERLGEDPEGAAEILRQRAAGLATKTDEIRKAAAYLDECTTRRVRARTADHSDFT